jgi:hypothetical protein
MSAVQPPAIPPAQKGGMKLLLPAALLLLASPLLAQDDDRGDAYASMLGCSAFHTIESSTLQGDAAEAQRALAYDFAKVAVALAPDGQEETADSDLKFTLESYQKKLDTGDVREVAEGWTALESACRELYPARDKLVEAFVKSP